jgi:hypothetical protein
VHSFVFMRLALVEEAFRELYPNRQYNYVVDVKYSGKFKPFNARVQLSRFTKLQFRLSKEWKATDNEIVKGLVQVLFFRLLGGKKLKPTFNMNLYHSFLKKLPDVTERKQSVPVLVDSFLRVNIQFFHGFMEQPTIVWGKRSTTTLAHYDLHTDTIVMSTIFKQAPQHLTDYVMYHEMLHKKHQFTTNGKMARFHTKAFRDDEKKFGDIKLLEKELNGFLRVQRGKKRFSSWF